MFDHLLVLNEFKKKARGFSVFMEREGIKKVLFSDTESVIRTYFRMFSGPIHYDTIENLDV